MKARATSRILVIDANRDVMGYYRRLLEALGYGVETSTWSETSQGEIERLHPDLVLFDLLVDDTQEKQAWQLIRQLKASSFSASLPLLICAVAFVSPSFVAYLHEQNISILFKPLDTHLLNHTIRALLEPS